VYPDTDILDAWGNEIRDRTAQNFASATERDAQWPAPPNGALAYTVDFGILWLRRAGVWVQVYPPLTRTARQIVNYASAGQWVAYSSPFPTASDNVLIAVEYWGPINYQLVSMNSEAFSFNLFTAGGAASAGQYTISYIAYGH
jgi:hypothetical protein